MAMLDILQSVTSDVRWSVLISTARDTGLHHVALRCGDASGPTATWRSEESAERYAAIMAEYYDVDVSRLDVDHYSSGGRAIDMNDDQEDAEI